MNSTITREIYELEHSNDQVRPQTLSSILDRYGTQLKVLSLDCFDTLLFRKTATPQDVFYALCNKKESQVYHLTVSLRLHAEQKARQKKYLQREINEVRLKDIYAELYPTLSAAECQELVTTELLTECEHCYAFPPVVELMLAAKQRGLTIIIVSDTYFSAQQLQTLLKQCLPATAFACISHIFCSSEYGQGKANGIFATLLPIMGVFPNQVLHIGDNAVADYLGARTQKLHALHLLTLDRKIVDLLRLRNLSAKLINPAIHQTLPLPSLFHGLLALQTYPEEKPETFIGYAALGAILYPFACFITAEIAKATTQYKQVKVLFLMRDAYLP